MHAILLSPMSSGSPPQPNAPLLLGRYEVYEAIASGGMATVHYGRVRGDAGFARTVAVKRMHKQLASNTELVRMFMDEARLVARIRHPNVLPILDVVREGDEIFLVMEYVHGEPLDRLIHHPTSDPIPPAIAAALFADVLHGLQAAHDATTASGEPLNIVHRDVTPHNMLIGVDGSARIADFGIAKATSREQMLTQAGTLKGKLSYLAPEQLDGQSSPATDIYAASVSLYEALTGRILFSGNSEGAILHKVSLGATKPPSTFVPSLSSELDEIVMRGLEMKPHKRFAAADEMAQALERAIERPAASAIAQWVESRAGAMLRQRSDVIALIDKSPFHRAASASQVSITVAPTTPRMGGAPPVSAPPVLMVAATSPALPIMQPLLRTHPAIQHPAIQHPHSNPNPNPNPNPMLPTTTKMMELGQQTIPGLPSRRSRSLFAIAIPIMFGMAVGGIALGTIAWMRSHRGIATSDAPDGATALTSASPFSTTSSQTDFESQSPFSTTTDPSTTARSPQPRPHGLPPTTSAGSATPVASSSAAPATSGPPDPCNPPYTRDETGRKLYKRECL